MKDQHMPFLKSCAWALTIYIHLLTNFTNMENRSRWTNAEVQVFLYIIQLLALLNVVTHDFLLVMQTQPGQ